MAVFFCLFVFLFILIILGVPLLSGIGLISLIWCIIEDINLQIFASRIFQGMNAFVLLALPLFIFAGEIMNRSGITRRLVSFVNIIVGRFRGALAHANIYVSMLFAGISGSAISDAAALGSIFIPAMEEEGYTRSYSAMITAASSIVGPIIPPSITVILYGASTGVSVGAMFAATMLPGIILGFSMSAVTIVYAKKRNFPKLDIEFTMGKFLKLTKEAILALVMPIIILGGIFGGIFTPTEAAAVAVLYAIFIGVFVYKKIGVKEIYEIVNHSVRVTARVLIVVGVCSILGWLLSRVGLPLKMYNFFFSITEEPLLIMLMITGFLLFVGTWLDVAPAIVLLAPVLSQLAEMIGYHPIHFGAIMVISLIVGLITPPMGLCLFTVTSVGKVPFEDVVRELWPLLLVDVAVIILIIIFPTLTLMMPRAIGLI
jgi:tripartite ATP-independent transporter DctM subunit